MSGLPLCWFSRFIITSNVFLVCSNEYAPTCYPSFASRLLQLVPLTRLSFLPHPLAVTCYLQGSTLPIRPVRQPANQSARQPVSQSASQTDSLLRLAFPAFLFISFLLFVFVVIVFNANSHLLSCLFCLVFVCHCLCPDTQMFLYLYICVYVYAYIYIYICILYRQRHRLVVSQIFAFFEVDFWSPSERLLLPSQVLKLLPAPPAQKRPTPRQYADESLLNWISSVYLYWPASVTPASQLASQPPVTIESGQRRGALQIIWNWCIISEGTWHNCLSRWPARPFILLHA